MKKHFYSHLLEISSIHTKLDSLGLTVEEKEELIVIAESSIHHYVIHTVLTHLSDEDKKLFLSHVSEDKHEESLELIKNKIENAEEKILEAVNKIITDLHQDIEESRQHNLK